MGDSGRTNNAFAYRNRNKATPGEIRKMCPQQRARYMAYEEPPKEIQNEIDASRQRVCARLTSLKMKEVTVSNALEAEKKVGDSITCQLKAAEALSRMHMSKLRRQQVKAKEINLLVCYQPTAWGAISLENLLPLRGAPTRFSDVFVMAERHRVEELLDDNMWDTLQRY
ncbi:hypothetical protein AALO_G00026030 [Alosa alosa]|uniref:Uncharacterized protein n=1 Tax=Alosa alosa TaxID=278164 RepID=A0AAV6HFU3_9TELE|nr:hypothetical protein AALO_G00026030 [Alosa alosa]